MKGLRCVAAVAALIAAMAGCVTAHREDSAAVAAPHLVWPAPPDAPRIVHVQSISGPADVGIKVSAGARALRWIFGSNKNSESLVKPFGVALDEAANLCITDTGANAVCFYDRTKRTWQRWDKIGNVRFASPVAAAKHNDKIFVADSGLGAVVAFSTAGKFLFTITNRVQRPAGLTISRERLLVVDSLRHAVLVFDLNGRFVSEFGKRGAGNGEFNYPTHVAADSEGNLLVTDSMNGRVQMFDMAGHFKSLIGSAGDAPGHFGRSKGLAVDSYAHVYVVDGLFDVV